VVRNTRLREGGLRGGESLAVGGGGARIVPKKRSGGELEGVKELEKSAWKRAREAGTDINAACVLSRKGTQWLHRRKKNLS